MIRIAVIGRNFVVDWFLEAAKGVPELCPAAVYSRGEETARAFAQRHHLSQIYTDLNVLAQSEEIDAVYIASPNRCHYEQAALMLRSGKHVLCEKPAADHAGQVRSLIALADMHGVVFLEAMRPVFDDLFAVVQKNLSRIGPLRYVRFELSKVSSRYDRQGGWKHKNAFDPSLSNAAIMDLGCYCIHSIVSLFGRPQAVSAQSVKLENGFEGCGAVLMQYPTFLAEAVYSKITEQSAPSVLVGELGTITIDDINQPKQVCLRLPDGTVQDLGYREKLPSNMAGELQAFCSLIENGARPGKYNEDSVLTLEVIDAARKQTGIVFPSDEAFPVENSFGLSSDWS